MVLKLRDYQEDVINKIYANHSNGIYRNLVMAATGSGKSIMITKMALDASKKRKRVLIVAHRSKLVTQLKATIEQFTPYKVGMIMAGKKVNYQNHFVFVAMAQTLNSRKLPEDIDVVIFDECHETLYLKVAEKIFDKYCGKVWDLSKTQITGLTATPYRMKKKEGFCRWFKQTIKAPTVRSMINNGYLTKEVCYSYSIEGLEDLVESSNGDYTLTSLAKACSEEYNADIVAQYTAGFKEKKAIAFCATVDQAKDLAKQFTACGLPSLHIDGSMSESERNVLYKRFKDGDIRVLVSIVTLTTGYDETSIEAVILARPTKSIALLIQMIGRGLRLHPGKETVDILDFGQCFHRITKVQGKAIADHIDINYSRLCPVRNSNPGKMEEKECPNCGHKMRVFARFCDQCEHEFIGKLKPKPETIRFPELEPFMSAEGYKQYKWLRSYMSKKFQDKKSPLQVFAKFNSKFNRLPPNDFFLGAIFNLDNSEVNYKKFKEYFKACGIDPVTGLKFFQLEFGEAGRVYKTGLVDYTAPEKLVNACKKFGLV